ncbi:hypothetical protein NVP1231O_08 [Vibrio phage 1.231.O._10N.261.49.F8]|nr:hypothetical protein NVP1119O_08 [Vibrio phage 1.119.O._10N.261.51.A9]AUR90380.1 hypothetical protein NVP1143O_08 [Vibrio phage 1.143.O._10N.261.55.C8]AUR96666.1 hypothetical protein NVP1231O_08 [Vibrio phage 1.231.O._10N.261.49.F8]
MECIEIKFEGDFLPMKDSDFKKPLVVYVPFGSSVDLERSKFNEGVLIIANDGDKSGVALMIASRTAKESFKGYLDSAGINDCFLNINIKKIDINVEDKSDPLWLNFPSGDLPSISTRVD